MKYLNTDGSVDEQALKDGIEKHKIWAAGKGISEERINAVAQHAGQCHCDCHRKDMNVMH